MRILRWSMQMLHSLKCYVDRRRIGIFFRLKLKTCNFTETINYKVQIEHDSLHDAFIVERNMNETLNKKRNQDLILIPRNKIIN